MKTYSKPFIFLILLLLNSQILYPQWIQTNIPDIGITCMAVSENKIIAGTHSGGVYLSTDKGTNWYPINNDLPGNRITALIFSEKNIFAGTGNYGVFLSTNNGINWTQVNDGFTNNPGVYSLAVSGTNIYATENNSLVFGGAGGVYLSTNNGTNWTLKMSRIYSQPLLINENNIFAGTYADGVFLSTDNGSSWTQVINGMSGIVYSLAASGSNIFSGTGGNGVFLSTNNGTDWAPVNNGLTIDNHGLVIYSLAASGANLFAGTMYGGVFLSTNNGTNWTQINDGLNISQINALIFSEPYIFAGTFYHGVWKRPLSELVGVTKEINNQPKDYSLSQNYPNPFNPTTTISYRLKEQGYVKLNVYDITGKHIQTLVSQTQNPGSYETQFNANGLASGIYFYRLEVFGKSSSPVFSDIKKLILLK